MAQAKRYLFSEHFQEVAQLGFILSHPARLRIVELLAQEGVLESAQVVDRLPLSAATVSKHLRYLERAGLLRFAATPFGTAGYQLIEQRLRIYQEALVAYFDFSNMTMAA
ncbi:MAG: helix-turn-helix domain-containing protein [Bacteroidota bacterium]